jgi:hypothetical protein
MISLFPFYSSLFSVAELAKVETAICTNLQALGYGN